MASKELKNEALVKALREYSILIRPWAKSVAETMLRDIARRDQAMWFQLGNQVGRDLKKEIENAPTGLAMAEALHGQIGLISSLPLEAAERVHELTLMGLSDSTRASEMAKEIFRTGHVTKSRATLIARTEVGRTATELTKSRALHVGVETYIWRTSRDADVRESHRHMEGKVIRFDDAPEVERGKKYHAGCFPNCRCYAEPVVPEQYN